MSCCSWLNIVRTSLMLTKYEKSEVIRSDEGNLVITDGDSVVAKGMGIIVPAIISVFAAIYWLSTI